MIIMINFLINFAEKEEDFPLLKAASIIIIRTYGVILWLQALFERWVAKQSKIVFVFNIWPFSPYQFDWTIKLSEWN